MTPGRYGLGGRVAVVTGAGAGIGAATSRLLARRGASLVLIDNHEDALARVAADCPSSLALAADVADDAALRTVVAAAVEHFGGIDVVVANAGIAAPGTVRSQPPEDFARVLDVNLLGAWRTFHAALEPVRQRGGYLVAVGSVAALAHLPGLGAYSASKAGLEALCDSLRIELRPHGVGVGYAYLLWVRTVMLAGAAGRAGRMPVPAPFDRIATPEAAAQALVAGIEHRRARIAHPAWLRAVLPARGLLQPLAERGSRRARR